jgi:Polyketide cyclase / dehydrase and lipid transport
MVIFGKSVGSVPSFLEFSTVSLPMNIEVSKSAKCYSKESIRIDASTVIVFNLIADINNWKQWQSKVKKATLVGEPEVGKNFKWTSGGLPISSRFHTILPFAEIGWTGRIWWIHAIHNWTLRDDNGSCYVTVEESLSGFLTGFLKNSLHKGIVHSLSELKTAAEHR